MDKPERIYGSDAFAFSDKVSRAWTRDENCELPFPKQFLYKVTQDGSEVSTYDMLIVLAKYEKPVTLLVRDKKTGEMDEYAVVLYLDEFSSEVCASDIKDRWAVSLPRVNMMF